MKNSSYYIYIYLFYYYFIFSLNVLNNNIYIFFLTTLCFKYNGQVNSTLRLSGRKKKIIFGFEVQNKVESNIVGLKVCLDDENLLSIIRNKCNEFEFSMAVQLTN